MVEPLLHKETNDSVRVKYEVGTASSFISDHATQCVSIITDQCYQHGTIHSAIILRQQSDQLGRLRQDMDILVGYVFRYCCCGLFTIWSVDGANTLSRGGNGFRHVIRHDYRSVMSLFFSPPYSFRFFSFRRYEICKARC